MTKLNLGDNIEASLDGSILTMVIDLSKRVGVSKSGKSDTIASTYGNKTIVGKTRMGLNLYEKR